MIQSVRLTKEVMIFLPGKQTILELQKATHKEKKSGGPPAKYKKQTNKKLLLSQEHVSEIEIFDMELMNTIGEPSKPLLTLFHLQYT